jgi:hypothetical protein
MFLLLQYCWPVRMHSPQIPSAGPDAFYSKNTPLNNYYYGICIQCTRRIDISRTMKNGCTLHVLILNHLQRNFSFRAITMYTYIQYTSSLLSYYYLTRAALYDIIILICISYRAPYKFCGIVPKSLLSIPTTTF